MTFKKHWVYKYKYRGEQRQIVYSFVKCECGYVNALVSIHPKSVHCFKCAKREEVKYEV